MKQRYSNRRRYEPNRYLRLLFSKLSHCSDAKKRRVFRKKIKQTQAFITNFTKHTWENRIKLIKSLYR